MVVYDRPGPGRTYVKGLGFIELIAGLIPSVLPIVGDILMPKPPPPPPPPPAEPTGMYIAAGIGGLVLVVGMMALVLRK